MSGFGAACPIESPGRAAFERKGRVLDLIQSLCNEFETLSQENARLHGQLGSSGVPCSSAGVQQCPETWLFNHADRFSPAERPWGPNTGRPPLSCQGSPGRESHSMVFPAAAQDLLVIPPKTVKLEEPPEVTVHNHDLKKTWDACLRSSTSDEETMAAIETFRPSAMRLRDILLSTNIRITTAQEDVSPCSKQFHRLEDDASENISLETCLQVCQRFSETPVDSSDLAKGINSLCAHNGEDDVLEPSLNFEQFEQLMNGQEFPSEGSASSVALVVLQKSLKSEAERYQKAKLTLKAERHHARMLFYLDFIPAVVIILNAIVLGFRPDMEKSWFWSALDIAFLIFYIGEAAVKIQLFGCRGYWCGPEKFWNWFDASCIFVSLGDLIIMHLLPLIFRKTVFPSAGSILLLKMFRLAKLGRLMKALKYGWFHELKDMIFGVVSGLRVLGWSFVLLVGIIFFLGVFMRVLCWENDEFSTVPASMFTVFRCFVDGCSANDGTPLQERLRTRYGAPFMIAYFLSMIFVQIGVFNLIMAIFIDTVAKNSDKRLQEELGSSATKFRLRFEAVIVRLILKDAAEGTFIGGTLNDRQRKVLKKQFSRNVDTAFQSLPHDLQISRVDFKRWLKDEEFVYLLDLAEVDTSNQTELFDVLDADMSAELGFREVVDGLMKLRGPVTKCDMIAIRLKIRYCTKMLQAITKAMDIDVDSDIGTVSATTAQTWKANNPARYGKIGW